MAGHDISHTVNQFLWSFFGVQTNILHNLKSQPDEYDDDCEVSEIHGYFYDIEPQLNHEIFSKTNQRSLCFFF